VVKTKSKSEASSDKLTSFAGNVANECMVFKPDTHKAAKSGAGEEGGLTTLAVQVGGDHLCI